MSITLDTIIGTIIANRPNGLAHKTWAIIQSMSVGQFIDDAHEIYYVSRTTYRKVLRLIINSHPELVLDEVRDDIFNHLL